MEEAVQALIQFPAADGYIHLTWRAAMRRNNVIVQGQKGTLLIDDDRLLLTTPEGKREEEVFGSPLSGGSHHADWFEPLLNDFVNEVRDPKLRGKNFREAGWCLALTTAAYQSNLQGFKEMEVVFLAPPNSSPPFALTFRMKLATFNANSIRVRQNAILGWLKAHQPDVLCVQETKVQDHEFPKQPYEDAGYHVNFRGMKSYNGVAILSRKKPESIYYGVDESPEGDAAKARACPF